MKKYFYLLVYISLAFLFFYLIKFEYFRIDNISLSYPYLFTSILFLCLGFLLDSITWWKILSFYNIRIHITDGIASHGLVVFSKYVPGKVWTILGRASYVSAKNFPLAKTSLISLKAQIINIWIGLFLGGIPLIIFQGLTKLSILSFFIIIVFTLFIISKKIHDFILFFLSKIFKKKIEIPFINSRDLIKISIYYGLYWILLIIGYFFLVKSFYVHISIIAGFAFPLSATLGILAILFPAGLGVRESVMIGYLTSIGIPTKEAATISILARLWFIIGEIFIFLLAFLIHKKNIGKNHSTI